MRISGWQIEGFGIFRDFEVRLPQGLTVFLGPNETGKSTLLGFLRAMLFGFPSRRSRAPQYPPLRGGRHGGRLLLTGPEGEVAVERVASRKNGLRINGREGMDGELQAMLGGADENVFCSVFAFSLSEMESFEWLQAEQIRERIFSAGIAGAGASARRAIETLDEEAKSLWRQRGGSRVRELMEQIEQARDRLQAAQSEAGRYVLLEQECEKWTAQAAALAAEEAELRTRLEQWSGAGQARRELAALAVIDQFPGEPEAKSAALRGSVEARQALLRRLEEERSSTAELRAQLVIDDRLESIFNSVEEFHSRLALHRDRLESLSALRGVGRVGIAWRGLGLAVAFLAGWLAGGGRMAPGWALLLVDLLAAGFLLYQRCSTVASLERRIAGWEAPVREWLPSSNSGESLIAEFVSTRAGCYKNREVRAKAGRLEEALAESDGRLDSARRELAAAEEALVVFLRECGASNEADFQERLRTFRKRQDLSARVREAETNESAPLRERLREVQKQRDVAIGEQRVADAERRRIAESPEVPSIQAELESLRAETAVAVRDWRIATLARELVARTLQEFTRSRQPAVLQDASSAFARVTGGAYERILQEEDRESLVVLDRNGQSKRPEELSRGTAEQLYLCLRLGLAAEFARRSASLPLIMDDVLVNFDPQRARAVAQELAHFSQRHQVLIFTCHPETARLFVEVAPDAAVIPMERQRASAAQE